MNPDEIIRALRENADWCGANEYEIPLCMGDNQREAADLIESLQADLRHEEKVSHGQMEQNKRLRKMVDKLQANLAESQRRERAAVEDITQMACQHVLGNCTFCKHRNNLDMRRKPCKGCEQLNGSHKNFEWRGPQEAGKGDSDGAE